MNRYLQINNFSKAILLYSFLLINHTVFSQNENLIIGRTTGNINLKKNLDVRVFGFSKSLSGAIFLPGPCLDVIVKDTVNIDFWNISQGNPASLICDSIEFVQYNKDKEQLLTKQPIDHMEHGFYSFTAKKPGIYLYYSPENYPFNIQAGMFGTIIIRDKTNDSLTKAPRKEVLWCSSELDTKWHTNEIMNVEHDNINEQLVLPDYLPDYFLINGKRVKKIKGLQPIKNKELNNSLIIRLVNAGLLRHEIAFPLEMDLQFVFGKATNLTQSSKSFKVILNKGECIELLASLKNVTKKEQIIYKYIDPTSNTVKNKTSIPVFFKN